MPFLSPSREEGPAAVQSVIVEIRVLYQTMSRQPGQHAFSAVDQPWNIALSAKLHLKLDVLSDVGRRANGKQKPLT